MDINQKQRRLVFIIGGLVGIVVVLLIVGSLVTRSSVGPLFNQLVAAETESLRINELAQKRAPDLATSQVQANVAAVLSSDLADLEIERQKVSSESKVPDAVTASVTNAQAESLLDSAVQRGDLTNEYRDLMAQSLEQTLAKARELRSSTKRENVQNLLDRVIEHLETLQEQVETL